MSAHEDLVSAGRAAYDDSRWGEAQRAFVEAAATERLDAGDLERLAWAHRWLGETDPFVEMLERAEAAYTEADQPAGAARMALEQARHHAMMRNRTDALMHYVRATEHLAEAPECAEHAQERWSLSFTLTEEGEDEAAEEVLIEARQIAQRVGSPGMEAMAVQGLAHLAAARGDAREARALVDDAAVLAMRPGVEPVHAGYVYCAIISICRSLCDWGRATEWTEVTTRYCDRQSIAGYTGLCRFHQGEIDRLHGQLAEAEARVLAACEELLKINRYSASWGYSELAEIRLRRGDLDGAEEAVAEAVALGDDGQPARGRLLLARGDTRAAVRSLAHALDDTSLVARERRVNVLPVYITACLAIGDEATAASSVEQLDDLAGQLGTAGPEAAAAIARGQLALHRGDAQTAIGALREGVRGWSELDAPFEVAQARVCLARALATDGDRAGAELELRAAQRLADDFGLAVDVGLAPERDDGVRVTRTFFFSDIVDSTKLSEAMGDAGWEPLLRWHDRTLRAEFNRWDGVEIKHSGDGFFVAFADPSDGLECAAAIQRALARHRQDNGFAPGVRIGLHVGTATSREGDYFGSAVTRAARISASAGSGEVVVSRALLDECRTQMPVVEERRLDLKGIDGDVAAVSVDWSA
ncbi:MAG: adenylate/guanylate cyclase domain-containing protein [Actinomycetota bacterium]